MASPTAVIIGNFDGVHLGHVQLVKTAREAIGAAGQVVVMSFDPHPLSVLRPEKAPQRLTNFSQRAELLVNAGADEVVALRPTKRFLNQSAPDFITSVVESHHPNIIVEGPDFRFGQGRIGTVQTLRELGINHGFETRIIDPVHVPLIDHNLVIASSSVARWMLLRGRVGDAARILGRPYELTGAVVRGDQRGRTINVPTINIDHEELLLPRDGVYSGTVTRDGAEYAAAISVGGKPTFGHHARVCEAHLLGYHGELDDYGWLAQVRFREFLRDQLTYTDVRLLTDQINRDINRVKSDIGLSQWPMTAHAGAPAGVRAPST